MVGSHAARQLRLPCCSPLPTVRQWEIHQEQHLKRGAYGGWYRVPGQNDQLKIPNDETVHGSPIHRCWHDCLLFHALEAKNNVICLVQARSWPQKQDWPALKNKPWLVCALSEPLPWCGCRLWEHQTAKGQCSAAQFVPGPHPPAAHQQENREPRGLQNIWRAGWVQV